MSNESRRDAPVGVFDSGIGGLSILSALRVAMPRERFVYLSDGAHAPYGERSDDYVLERSREVARQLIAEHDIKALVVACNTATAAGIAALRAEHPKLSIVGVEPALKPAVALSHTRRIGVMATRGTLASQKFASLHAGLQQEANFVLQPCDGLAEAIENDRADDIKSLCVRYLGAMGRFGDSTGQIDTLVLGCTHYPFIADVLLELLPDEVQLVHTGPAVARQTQRVLRDMGIAREEGAGSVTLESTGDVQLLQRAADRWL